MLNTFLIIAVLLQTVASYTIFYDSMDNAVATGWTFSGNYLAPTNDDHCPSGGHCTGMYSVSFMTKTFSSIASLSALQIKYDITCLYDCHVYYKYDNHAWITLKTFSPGWSYSTYKDQTHTLAAPTGATSVTFDNIYFTANPTPSPTTSDPDNQPSSITKFAPDTGVFFWIFGGSVLICILLCLGALCQLKKSNADRQREDREDQKENETQRELKAVEMKMREFAPDEVDVNASAAHKPSAPDMEQEQDEEKEDADAAEYCIICCDNVANMFNDPCGHVTYCINCASNTLLQNSQCPCCRQNISDYKQIFPAGFVSN